MFKSIKLHRSDIFYFAPPGLFSSAFYNFYFFVGQLVKVINQLVYLAS